MSINQDKTIEVKSSRRFLLLTKSFLELLSKAFVWLQIVKSRQDLSKNFSTKCIMLKWLDVIFLVWIEE